MQRAFLVAGALSLAATGAARANLLVNPGFESGLSGWTPFGNVFAENANPPQFVPHSGNGLVSMFGNFSGGFNVSGIFQEFPAPAGSAWSFSVFSEHYSGDALVGAGAPNANWVVEKLAFFDSSHTEITSAAATLTILDGTFATNTWFNNAAINAVAPVNSVSVQALVLYLQPAFAGGAAHIDDAVLTPAPGSLVMLGLGGVLGLRRPARRR